MTTAQARDLDVLASTLETLKWCEERIIAERRKVEDRILESLGLSAAFEGAQTFVIGDDLSVKLTGRMNRKVDSDRLQELAAESGLSEHLTSLFRWKPELNLSAWKNADPTITTPLAGAITTTPGRPSVAIVRKES